MTERATEIRAELTPIVEGLGLAVYDVTLTGGARPTLTVLVDRDHAAGTGGVDLETLETVTRALSAALDASDPITGRYLLEVSSPGLERPLREPEHYRRAVGETVTLRVCDDSGHHERVRGRLEAADDEAVTIATDAGARTVPLSAVEAARTVFEWGPAPKPGRGSRPGRKKEAAAR